MWVYLIRSVKDPSRKYVGVTEDFECRLAEHNEGKSTATYKFKPWKCEVKVWFNDSEMARSFEIYLKSGSGRAFSKRHLWK